MFLEVPVHGLSCCIKEDIFLLSCTFKIKVQNVYLFYIGSNYEKTNESLHFDFEDRSTLQKREIYGFEMIKIESKTGKRILIDGRDLRLATYCNNDNVWFWYIYTKEEVNPGLFSKSGEYFKLFLEMGQKYSYPAYESRMYCIYLGYKYDVENIWHGLFILYPNERKTRRYLKLNDRDDSRIEVPYEEFIASSPIIWEERKPISDFVFDVEPLVYLFKDDSYIEENLHGAWHNKISNKENE